MSNQTQREPLKVKLTKTIVADAAPTGSDYILWDSALPGFGLRVRKTGGKAYIFAYRTPGGRAGSWKRVTIKNPLDKTDQARAKAKDLFSAIHGGSDPAEEKAEERREAVRGKSTPTVSQILDRFITDHAKEHLKPKTAAEYERTVEKVLKPKLGAHRIDELEPKHVAEMHHDMRGTPTQAALTVRILSSAMRCAEEWGFRPPGSNPAKIRLKGTRRRERLFSDVEVARMLKALTRLEAESKVTKSVARAIRLLFATGCRAGEICSLKWEGVDLEEGLLRWEDSKTGVMEKVITAEARKLLTNAERIDGLDWVCPSPLHRQLRVETLEAGFERVMKAADVKANENATLHLIRHWFATKIYSDASLPLPLQMAIVGHKSVATAMRYAHVGREELKRAAQQAAKKRATALKAAGKRGKVVKLPSREAATS